MSAEDAIGRRALIQAAVHKLRVLEGPGHSRAREVGESRKPRGLGYPLGYLRVVLRSWLRARRSVRRSGGGA